MAEGAGQPAADWYDDPHYPGRMRYFDGEAWTNHFHYPSKLPDIGEWVSTTFAVFRRHWRGAAIIAVISSFVGNTVTWLTLPPVVEDVAVIDEDLIGVDLSVVLGLLFVVVFTILWQAAGWLALNRYMQRAHFDAAPSLLDAAARAVRRLPQYLGYVIALALAAFVALLVVAVAALVSPALAVLVGLALLVGLVWALVKLSFLISALAAAPNDVSPLQSSMQVSNGRFWGVFGRLIVLTLGVGITANILGSLAGDFGSPIDQEAVVDIVQTRGDEIEIQDFTVAELLPSTSQLLGVVLVSTALGAATNMVSTSAMMRLYLDSGAPSDVG